MRKKVIVKKRIVYPCDFCRLELEKPFACSLCGRNACAFCSYQDSAIDCHICEACTEQKPVKKILSEYDARVSELLFQYQSDQTAVSREAERQIAELKEQKCASLQHPSTDEEAIVVEVKGGNIQHIENIPAGVQVLVKDYDQDGTPEAEFDGKDEGGTYTEAVWESQDRE